MKMARLFFTDQYRITLPEGHKFPAHKYGLVRQLLQQDGDFDFVQAPVISPEIVELAHDPKYVRSFIAGSLPAAAMRRIGLPWSEVFVQRALASVGGTLGAAHDALDAGWGGTLGGGTHHAFRDRGEGYCVFNDSAIAALTLQAEGKVRRVAILDCDVHQGNGTAAILADDPTVFTLSVHGANNFPFDKQESDLDIELPDSTGDRDYLAAVEAGVCRALSASQPDLAIYLAGADPFEGDRLGRLAITKKGLAARDRLVFELCQSAGVAVAIGMAGGYARRIEDSVDIHLTTVRTAAELLVSG